MVLHDKSAVQDRDQTDQISSSMNSNRLELDSTRAREDQGYGCDFRHGRSRVRLQIDQGWEKSYMKSGLKGMTRAIEIVNS